MAVHLPFETLWQLWSHDVYPHLLPLRLLAVAVPLFLQSWMLVAKQTERLRWLRMALVPFGVYYACQVLLYDFEPRDSFKNFNFIKNVICPACIAKTLEFGFVQRRYRWIGYDQAYKPPVKRDDVQDRGNSDELEDVEAPPFFSLRAFQDAIALQFCHRGQGWNWGIKGRLIPEPYPQDTFLVSTLVQHTRAYILLLLSISSLQYSGLSEGKGHFLRGLGLKVDFPGSAIASELLLAIVFGTAVWNFLDLAWAELVAAAYLCTALGRKICPASLKPPPFDSRAWPPLLQNPLHSDSLADWWTYRWHSLLRREFIVVGFKPAQYLTHLLGNDASVLCGVLGSFLVSGILHETAIYFATSEIPMDKSFPSVRFFMSQGFGLVLEQLFIRLTGRPVGGLLGRIWTALALGLPGAAVTREWLGRGLIDSTPTPDTWEWWRWTFPALMYLPRVSSPA